MNRLIPYYRDRRDGAGRMITKRYLTGGLTGALQRYANTTALVGYTTSFDRAGNKLYERHLEAESRSHLYQPFNSDGSFAVGYDSANRLRQYQRGILSSDTIPYRVNAGSSISSPTTLPGAEQVRTYGLDGLGNWKTTACTEVGSGGSTTNTAEVRQHNYLNEITSTKDTVGGTPQDSVPFTYDKNGNLLNDGVRSYQWDTLNRLVQVNRVSDGAIIGAYAYDALNRRIQKVISNGGLTGDITNGTVNYLYEGQQVSMSRDADGNWTQAYFWGQYIDELLFFAVPTITVPTTYRVLSDLLYRSTAIVTTSNIITEAYDTDAYGNTLCYSGPGTDGLWFTDDDVTTNNPINTTIFTGRQFDPESQIYYYRARYYAPQIGRFLSRDPLGSPTMMVDAAEPWGSAELTQGPNLYWYVHGNPANMIDPEGLASGWGQVANVFTGLGLAADAAFALCQQAKCKKDCLSCCSTEAGAATGSATAAYAIRFVLCNAADETVIAIAGAIVCLLVVTAGYEGLLSRISKDAKDCNTNCQTKP